MRKQAWVWLALALAAVAQPAARLVTILGDPIDGRRAKVTPLWRPSGVVVAPDGAVYVADDGSGAVRRIDPQTGIARIVASGLHGPWALAVGPGGALHVIDARRNRIVRFDSDGNLTPVAGSGVFGDIGDGGPATAARLGLPQGMAFDSAGNLFIADSDNRAIRRVDAKTGVITTIAAGLQYPWGIALDSAGNIFVADTYANVIRRIEAGGGAMKVVAGNGKRETSGDGGPALSAGIEQPTGLAVAPNGDLYIGQNQRLRKVDAGSGVISTIFGGGRVPVTEGDGKRAADITQAGRVGQLTLAANTLLFALPDDNAVARIDLSGGKFEVVAGNPLWVGDGSRAIINVMAHPRKLVLDGSGILYIADFGHNRVMRAPLANLSELKTIAGEGIGGMRVTEPEGLAVDAAGTVYFTDRGLRVLKIAPGGKAVVVAGTGERGYAGDGAPAATAQLNAAGALAVDADGNVYIADNGNRRVRVVARNGVIRTLAGSGEFGDSGDGGPAMNAKISWISDLLLDGRGGLLLADQNNDRIRRVDLAAGTISTVAKIAAPRALARSGDVLFAAGPDTLYRLAEAPEALFKGELGSPEGLVVDAKGRLIFSDSQNSKIRLLEK